MGMAAIFGMHPRKIELTFILLSQGWSTLNRVYPENAYFKTRVPRTLEFHTVMGFYKT